MNCLKKVNFICIINHCNMQLAKCNAFINNASTVKNQISQTAIKNYSLIAFLHYTQVHSYIK